jgi:transposase
VQQRVDVRLRARTVEVFFKGNRVAVHRRSRERGGFTALDEHRPKSHRRHLEWTPSRIIDWAGKIGPNCAEAAQHILHSKPHPEQGYRSCLGLIRLGKNYGHERVEAACGRALALDICSYQRIKSMLKTGRESCPLPDRSDSKPRPNASACIRGAAYYT